MGEVTGPAVAAIAGRVLARIKKNGQLLRETDPVIILGGKTVIINLCTLRDLKSLAASALTQAGEKDP